MKRVLERLIYGVTKVVVGFGRKIIILHFLNNSDIEAYTAYSLYGRVVPAE